jgi:hypothetical protein
MWGSVVLPSAAATGTDHAGVQGAEREVGAKVVGHRPSHDAAGVVVKDRGQVQPPLPGADVRDVRDPQLVRVGRGEVAPHQVREQSQGVADGGPSIPSRVAADEAGEAHQPRDALATVPRAARPQLGLTRGEP